MNVPYNKTSAADAALLLGVNRTTVQAWCRNGIINAENVSNGTEKARWLICDDEIDYILSLKHKFGCTKSAMIHYRKDWRQGKQPAVKPGAPKPIVQPTIRDYIPSSKKEEPAKAEFDVEKLQTTIQYIQDVKKRIAECKDELQLLEKEYEDLKKEVYNAL